MTSFQKRLLAAISMMAFLSVATYALDLAPWNVGKVKGQANLGQIVGWFAILMTGWITFLTTSFKGTHQ